MSANTQIITTELALLVLFLLLCGCVSMSIGDVSYKNDGLSAIIYNPGEASDAFVQVTVYQVNGIVQQEHTVIMHPVKLDAGNNIVLIPGTLKPGTYKLYVYLIHNGERKTAVIRDIVV